MLLFLLKIRKELWTLKYYRIVQHVKYHIFGYIRIIFPKSYFRLHSQKEMSILASSLKSPVENYTYYFIVCVANFQSP